MTKRKAQSRVPDQIRELLSRRSAVSAGVVAEAAGITRQAAHYHLSHMVEAGELFLRGAGRGAHYVVATAFARTYPTAGLQEDAGANGASQRSGGATGNREGQGNDGARPSHW